MAKAYVFYNPLADNGGCGEEVKLIDGMIDDEKIYCDMTKGYKDTLACLGCDDYIVLCGGDGTLNRFINETEGVEIANDILYFASGSGNDFAHDLGHGRAEKPYSIKKYLVDLPCVTVNGKTCRFLNGVGYGIDGYCCEEGDRIRAEQPGAKVDYTSIAIKGLLFHYKPTNAKVTVDGEMREYKKVWIAPTMNGRFYGGGMMPTPNQDRLNQDKRLSTMIFHGSGKLKTLMIFPSLFKGEHVKHTKHVDVLTGREITVEFDRPVALQIDGETVLGVSSYTAKLSVPAKINA
ncbi:MAG: diacylglycerol kinase family protein [Ruminococcaceae bacterium]|nr:diacylglycerol kinase family protein [Oscillospiraceae bacterium]